MLRLIALLLIIAAPAFGADLPFVINAQFPHTGPTAARGALVWVPGTYGKDDPGPPPPPDLVGRLARSGLDVYQFNRKRQEDPLDGGAVVLARGLSDLRASGYRRVLAAGHSRGAWIALTAMARPGAADAIIAVSVGAHGTRPERQPQARADWQALWAAAQPGPTRVILVQLADDPYDADPRWRLDIARAAILRARLPFLSLFLPPEPLGHVGVYEPAFDEQLGDKIAAFANPK